MTNECTKVKEIENHFFGNPINGVVYCKCGKRSYSVEQLESCNIDSMVY